MTAGPSTSLFVGSNPAPLQDVILNPRFGRSLFAVVASGVTEEVLPLAPAGVVWGVFQGNVRSTGGSLQIREETPSEPVRVVDQRTGLSSVSMLFSGGCYTRGPLVLENTGAPDIAFWATVVALPAALVQPIWMELTDTFAPLPYVAPPSGRMLRLPFGGFNGGSNTSAWVLNTDATARMVEMRFTRGALAFTNNNSAATAANSRNSFLTGVGAWPPLLPGDLLEMRVTTTPASPVYFGGMLQTMELQP